MTKLRFPSTLDGIVYEEIRPIGSGGESVVYLARQLKVNGQEEELRTVAIKQSTERQDKQATDDWKIIRRFQRQARFMDILSEHPDIVEVIELYDEGERMVTPHIAMEYVPGMDLGKVLKKRRLRVPEVISVSKRVLPPLAYAHTRDVVHRDLKPSQIMLVGLEHTRYSLEGVPVKLLDFGAGRDLSLDETQSSGGVTHPYMTPEHLGMYDYSAATDVQQFVFLLFEMLKGRKIPRQGALHSPYLEPGIELFGFEGIIARGIREQPDQRPTTHEILEAIGRIEPLEVYEEPVVATAPTPPALPPHEPEPGWKFIDGPEPTTEKYWRRLNEAAREIKKEYEIERHETLYAAYKDRVMPALQDLLECTEPELLPSIVDIAKRHPELASFATYGLASLHAWEETVQTYMTTMDPKNEEKRWVFRLELEAKLIKKYGEGAPAIEDFVRLALTETTTEELQDYDNNKARHYAAACITLDSEEEFIKTELKDNLVKLLGAVDEERRKELRQTFSREDFPIFLEAEQEYALQVQKAREQQDLEQRTQAVATRSKGGALVEHDPRWQELQQPNMPGSLSLFRDRAGDHPVASGATIGLATTSGAGLGYLISGAHGMLTLVDFLGTVWYYGLLETVIGAGLGLATGLAVTHGPLLIKSILNGENIGAFKELREGYLTEMDDDISATLRKVESHYGKSGRFFRKCIALDYAIQEIGVERYDRAVEVVRAQPDIAYEVSVGLLHYGAIAQAIHVREEHWSDLKRSQRRRLRGIAQERIQSVEEPWLRQDDEDWLELYVSLGKTFGVSQQAYAMPSPEETIQHYKYVGMLAAIYPKRGIRPLANFLLSQSMLEETEWVLDLAKKYHKFDAQLISTASRLKESYLTRDGFGENEIRVQRKFNLE